MLLLGTLTAAAGLAPVAAAQKSVAVTPYKVRKADRSQFEEKFTPPVGTAEASLLLRRRNDIFMYGRLYDEQLYASDTPDYAAVHLFADPSSADMQLASHTWEATMIEWPAASEDAMIERLAASGSGASPPCFLAMNRFPVRAECNALFEERWATRETKLRTQPGFLAFSLLRSRSNSLPDEGRGGLGGLGGLGGAAPGASEHQPGDEPLPLCYTYSTATLWASEAHWTAWREGGGKSSHDASRLSGRTPVSEWMHGKASPVFWDVPILSVGRMQAGIDD